MPDKKKSFWTVMKERLDSIGALARATKPKKKKKPRIDTGRVSPTPQKPQLSPEQEEYLENQSKSRKRGGRK